MMNRDMKKATLVFVVFLVFTVSLALAATFPWHMKIMWKTKNETIGVYTDVECTVPWQHTLDLQYVTVGASEIQHFYIENEGNVPVDVTIASEVMSGATASWVPTSLGNLAIGDSALMTLTLTFTEQTETGSYEFDFSSSETP